ncbi:hypothetical protein GCM10023232_18800 [Sphingosinicella ginsenosidimutans]|jgi:hypothetical protein|uniref:hypothetical protein n=1 Tax=Allosphingosinicella ginsenosidimutans TaxID=1176539 RepID=UPI00131520BA|nr:hypothetical protein [Sphingosinicella ginsenosidimutans]
MDLDYLSRREREERQRAAQAECEQSRRAHELLADHYRERIQAFAPVAASAGRARAAG